LYKLYPDSGIISRNTWQVNTKIENFLEEITRKQLTIHVIRGKINIRKEEIRKINSKSWKGKKADE
jgi:hypothetical protein